MADSSPRTDSHLGMIPMGMSIRLFLVPVSAVVSIYFNVISSYDSSMSTLQLHGMSLHNSKLIGVGYGQVPIHVPSEILKSHCIREPVVGSELRTYQYYENIGQCSVCCPVLFRINTLSFLDVYSLFVVTFVKFKHGHTPQLFGLVI